MIGTIDRIEGKYAVILVNINDLPQGSAEGSVLDLNIKSNQPASKTKRGKIKKLLKSIFD